ncbi:MAG: anti-sigma factor [Methylobacterium mesophilicum]|nr:anti-sigma factor [Methylobacterium mesophilicum]
MSGDQRQSSENDLLAYVDGELTAPERERIRQRLATDPAAAALVEEWQRQNGRLDALYGHVAREPVPDRLRPASMERRPPRLAGPHGRRLAAAVLLVAMGAGSGWFGRDFVSMERMAAEPLETAAVEAHGLYASEVVHPVEVSGNESAHLQAWLSKRLDRALTIPNLDALGLTLVGGRLLPRGDQPAAQFMYEDGAGRRLTLYVVPTAEQGQTAFRYARAAGLEIISWKDANVRCVIIGDMPRDRLQAIAKEAYGQLI